MNFLYRIASLNDINNLKEGDKYYELDNNVYVKKKYVDNGDLHLDQTKKWLRNKIYFRLNINELIELILNYKK